MCRTETLAFSTVLSLWALNSATRIVHTFGLLWITDPSAPADDGKTGIDETLTLGTEKSGTAFLSNTGVLYALSVFARLSGFTSDLGTSLDALSFTAKLVLSTGFALAWINDTSSFRTDFSGFTAFVVAIVLDTNTLITDEVRWAVDLCASIETLAFFADTTFGTANG